MIFKETWRWVLDKSPYTGLPKTETRRPKRAGEVLRYASDEVAAVYSYSCKDGVCKDHVKYRIPNRYAIQAAMGSPALGTFVLRDIRSEPLDYINDADARKEGFRDRKHFFTTWRTLYNKTPRFDATVWVLSWNADSVVAKDDVMETLQIKEYGDGRFAVFLLGRAHNQVLLRTLSSLSAAERYAAELRRVIETAVICRIERNFIRDVE